MSERVEAVIDGVISEKQSVTLPVPEGVREVQVVLDRRRFEHLPDEHLVWVHVIGDEYLGGVRFNGGNISASRENEARPGGRMPWSFGRWQVKGEQVTIEVEPLREFDCLLHVDFL